MVTVFLMYTFDSFFQLRRQTKTVNKVYVMFQLLPVSITYTKTRSVIFIHICLYVMFRHSKCMAYFDKVGHFQYFNFYESIDAFGKYKFEKVGHFQYINL